MKEKIGIEKLIELLNEYENTDNWENRHQVEFRESKIISKKYGFIQWLVENDKIDIEKMGRFKAERKNTQIIAIANKSDFYLSLLMLLSINDNPIEFLISCLK